jgi:hypothetical protein
MQLDTETNLAFFIYCVHVVLIPRVYRCGGDTESEAGQMEV